MKTVQVIISLLMVICLTDTLKAMEPRQGRGQNVETSLDALNVRARTTNLRLGDLCALLAETFQLLQGVTNNEQLVNRVYEQVRYLRDRIELVMDVYDGPPPRGGVYNADEAIREIYRRKLAQMSERSGWYGYTQQGNSPYWG